jgi:hypothetical protein
MIPNKFLEEYKMPDPTCLYKWGWSTIFLKNGTTSSCHRTVNDRIDHTNFDTFHNTPLKLKTRQDMLDGKWPGNGCQYCKKIEDAGGISDRVDINSRSSHDLIPKELLENPKAINITPTMVEVYFSNLCNMSCIYCGPSLSSTWEHEARKFNLVPVEQLDRILFNDEKYKLILEKFWQWLAVNATNITKYNILGGEPFFQPELITNINFFETHPCPKLRLTIFSNLKVNHEKFKKILTQLNSLVTKGHLRSVEITCSLDAWGPQQEYVRTGLDLVQWEQNFDTLVKDFPQINVQVHGTMCSLTIKTIPALVEKIRAVNMFRQDPKTKPVYLTYNMVFNPDHMSPEIFPKGFFDEDFDKIDAVIKDEHDKTMMRGYQSSINAGAYNPALINNLKKYLNELDARRGTSWKPLFPWLDRAYD